MDVVDKRAGGDVVVTYALSWYYGDTRSKTKVKAEGAIAGDVGFDFWVIYKAAVMPKAENQPNEARQTDQTSCTH